jgi:ATP/maltotriose-dependent transcriptional regulator MalT
MLATHRLLGEIATVADHHARAAAHLAAALDLAARCEVPFERALTLLALADLRLATGLTDEAASLLAEISDICHPLDAAPTLAQVDALMMRLTPEPPAKHHPSGLTPREVEVLRLLPRGLSNREIATALFVSPRTIQSHLSNLYGKLGVRGRAEAIAFAVVHELV